jgi:hypothetical protein
MFEYIIVMAKTAEEKRLAHNEAMRKYAKKNRDKFNESTRKWRANNPEKERDNNRKSSNLYNARKAGFDSILEYQMDIIKRKYDKMGKEVPDVEV